MSYTRNTNFTAKDLLAPGAEGKTILGEEIQIELDEIAACMANLPTANNGALTGTTTAVNVTVSGDLTVPEDGLTIGSTVVTATGTELNNTVGSTSNIQDQLDALSANAGSSANVTPYRYWRLKLTTSANLNIRELRFWTNGSGFSNGLRWSPGILLDNATLAPTITTGPDSSGGTLGSGANLVDGSTSTTAALTKSGVGDFDIDIRIDFGENPQALSSMQLVMQTATDVISDFEILFSADNSTWTSVGTYDASSWTAAITDNVASPHFGIAYPSTSTAADYAVFPATVETIPPVTGGGGSGLWTWDTTVKTADFTAEVGKYHFVRSGTTDTDVTMTFPSSPSIGDVFLVRNIENGTATTNITGGFGVLVDDLSITSGLFVASASLLESGTPGTSQHAGFIYLETNKWYTFLGNVAQAA